MPSFNPLSNAASVSRHSWHLPPGLQNNRGFILPTTLVLLALLTMAAGYFAQWTQRGFEQTTLTLASSKAELELESTKATLLYLLATRRYTRGGLKVEFESSAMEGAVGSEVIAGVAASGNEITLDGQPYQGVGRALFAIQDCGGLLGLNALNNRRLERLLGLLGVPATERVGLVASLRDYTDLDDLHRLNGAEADDYNKSGLDGPANRPLLSAWESLNVLGWKSYPQLWQAQRLPLLTTAIGGGSTNLNTSPVEVLASIDGIDFDVAQRIVRARPLSGLTAASLAAGRPLPIDPLSLASLASKTLRLSLWHPDLNRSRLLAVQLTPVSKQRSPWMNIFELELPIEHDPQQVQPNSPPGPLFTTTDLVSN